MFPAKLKMILITQNRRKKHEEIHRCRGSFFSIALLNTFFKSICLDLIF